jgi:hypothetical protein
MAGKLLESSIPHTYRTLWPISFGTRAKALKYDTKGFYDIKIILTCNFNSELFFLEEHILHYHQLRGFRAF